ncbi:acyl-CoA dehydrogenase family protein [Paenibacillus wulumuqiensis]|uniref:acyl-CoA dehydrogenase family protein n=1 Tax=Paenibacillus wulumuqiensis TaxID=1567107 RepID=UPI0006197D39|nr:acyl-CoA dehydrogenase family protein [Paenibacillus wulumuqiensis]
MTDKRIDLFIRNEKEAELAAWADRLAVKFAERAAKHDEEGSFPFENFQELKEAGYAKLTVAREYGGEGLGLYEWLLVQERIARGDGSTALSAGWHGGMMLHFRESDGWPEPTFSEFCQDVVAHGNMINKFASERGTGSPTRGGRPQTTAVRTEGGWLLSGRKTYSTLSPLLTDFIVSAGIEDQPEIGDFLVRSRDGISIEETWNTLGMRATGSHDVILDQVFVPDRQVLSIHLPGTSKSERDDGDGWLLHIPACYLGIAYAARDFALEFAASYTPNSLNEPIATLPHIRQWIGQIESELRLARTLMYDVADRWDREPEHRKHMRPDFGLVKYNAVHLANQVVDKAMKIVGGAALSRNLPLERLYRDVRAGLHNPPMEDAVLQTLARTALEELS